jgi:hypothetical protein
VFSTLGHLTYATNTLDSNFPQAEYQTKRCGVETPSNEGDRIEDGRIETVVIKYDPDLVRGTWQAFLDKLALVKVGWEAELE